MPEKPSGMPVTSPRCGASTPVTSGGLLTPQPCHCVERRQHADRASRPPCVLPPLDGSGGVGGGRPASEPWMPGGCVPSPPHLERSRAVRRWACHFGGHALPAVLRSRRISCGSRRRVCGRPPAGPLEDAWLARPLPGSSRRWPSAPSPWSPRWRSPRRRPRPRPPTCSSPSTSRGRASTRPIEIYNGTGCGRRPRRRRVPARAVQQRGGRGQPVGRTVRRRGRRRRLRRGARRRERGDPGGDRPDQLRRRQLERRRRHRRCARGARRASSTCSVRSGSTPAPSGAAA